MTNPNTFMKNKTLKFLMEDLEKVEQEATKIRNQINNVLNLKGERKMTEYNYPKWEEVYTKELTLQALFEKLIDVENGLKDRIYELDQRIEKLEERLDRKDKIEMLRRLIQDEIEVAGIDGMEHGAWGFAEKQLDKRWKEFRESFNE